MPDESIRAYDLPGRVASYDADMDLMHPNRHKMAEMIVNVLTVSAAPPELVIDLGSGTGFLTGCLLRAFPALRVIAVDGAQQMVELARTRLGPLAQRVNFCVGDFRDLESLYRTPASVDAIVSAYALHHLSAAEKLRVLRTAHGLLKPKGWLLNADITLAEDNQLDALTQQLRVRGIVQRAQGRDPRFADAAATRQFLVKMESNEGDKPVRPAEDLRSLQEAGFFHITTFWRETREAVFGGMR
jgi:ubiquinone/menaquinone biosynthesis C-methylase UbiE